MSKIYSEVLLQSLLYGTPYICIIKIKKKIIFIASESNHGRLPNLEEIKIYMDSLPTCKVSDHLHNQHQFDTHSLIEKYALTSASSNK